MCAANERGRSMDGAIEGGTPSRRLSRRQVVRTAAHAAWTAPLIAAASAAPAFAGTVGAAAIVTGQPSFTIPTSHIRASTLISNQGVAAPASMMVTVTIAPTAGTLQNVDPRLLSNDFSFVSRTSGPGGSQTLVFSKDSPQIPPGGSTDLRFDFFQDPGAVVGRAGLLTVSPSVPPPSTAASNSNRYLAV